jgi:O-antigen/teichoic acid export membrane protein
MKLNLTQKVLYNVGTQAAGRVVALVLALLAVRVMTGYLGVDGYGNLAIVLAITGLLVSVTDFGITTILARETATAPEQADMLGGTLLRFRLASAAGAIALAVAVIPFLPYPSEVKVGLLIGLVGTFFVSVGRFPSAFFQLHLRMDLLAVLDVFYKAVSLLLVVAVVVLDLGFYALVAAVAFAGFLWFSSSFAVSKRFWRINIQAAPGRTRGLLRDSLGIWLVTIIGLLHFQGDMVLLSLLQPPAEVAIYSVAYKFVEQSFLLPGLFMGAVFPILARRIHENRERSLEVIQKAFAFLLLQAIPLTLVLAVTAGQLIRIVAPAEFDRAAEPLRVVSFSLPLIFASTIFFNVLILLNRQRALIGASLGSLALNMGLNLYFIPRYSYMGAAWTTLVSEAFAFVVIFLVAKRAYGLRVDYAFLGRLAVPTLLAGATVAAARALPATPTAVAALGVFVVGVVVARVVTRDDVRLVLGR